MIVSLGNNCQVSFFSQCNGDSQSWVVDVIQLVFGDGSVGGVGWCVQLCYGEDGNGGLVEVGIFNDVGCYLFGVLCQGGFNYVYVSVSGSLVWMGGYVFVMCEVFDVFVVISINGVVGVLVWLENWLIGVIDDCGLLLVSLLLFWQCNWVLIDILDLFEDMCVDCIEDWVMLCQCVGICVIFQLCLWLLLSLILLVMNGQFLEVGSEVQLFDGCQVMVGYDGLFYLEDVVVGSVLYVIISYGLCWVKVLDLFKVVVFGV